MGKQIRNVPCNIITGFLGAGKTTAILDLLANKPKGERWAVLVNEFGEIGIDGGLVQPQQDGEEEVFIREVPGGCMCCTAGLPMQMALNMLLTRAKPDRLIIEPTGLGHPREVLGTLLGESYRGVIDVCSTITLVDARNIADPRFTSNDTFLQQLDVADHIVANKSDLYGGGELDELQKFLASYSMDDKPLHSVVMGQLNAEWLDGAATAAKLQIPDHGHGEVPEPLPVPSDEDFPSSGYLQTHNEGDGFTSLGWLFKPEFCFSKTQLDSLLMGLAVLRLKAIMNTDSGFIAYNAVDGVMTEVGVEPQPDSRLEIITDDVSALATFGDALLACIDA